MHNPAVELDLIMTPPGRRSYNYSPTPSSPDLPPTAFSNPEQDSKIYMENQNSDSRYYSWLGLTTNVSFVLI